MLEILLPILAVYLIIINLVAFVLMFVDKAKAAKGKWRIPEKTLFLPVLLGGGIGGVAGMQIFRHKTKHWYFAIGFPAILVVEYILLAFVIFKFLF
ncbi:MAG: DUF1294 domain-containing protein [Lachnospiraceae bacterium]|nr:DUF1294 domain-containing protein [Lachnospiraceae bacterium]